MDDYFRVKGFGGQRKLRGRITVSGAKNSALKALAAGILFEDPIVLQNVPQIADIERTVALLTSLGADIMSLPGGYAVDTAKIGTSEIPSEIARKIRASIVMTGPLLARFGEVSFPHPGGCVIGSRPVDLFLDGFERMGAEIHYRDDRYTISARKGKLCGARIFFKNQTVTGTETFMMTAVLAEGFTILRNAACEPEIEHLANFLNASGADIKGAGTHTITIRGGRRLRANGIPFVTPPDRIETGSFLVLAALLGREVVIDQCDPSHVESVIAYLEAAGVPLSVLDATITVGVSDKPLRSLDVKTHEYPGFPTDLQAPMAVFLTQAVGEAMVFETIFEGRLAYAEELRRMGASIIPLDQHRILVKGPTPLRGREVESPDLRAGLAFLIAAMIAEGESVIRNVYNIDRGHERIEERLNAVGADIVRVKAHGVVAEEVVAA